MTRVSCIAMIAFALASCGDRSENQQKAAGAGADAQFEEAPPASDAPDQVRDAEVATHEAEGPFTGIMIAEDGTPVEVRYRKVGELAIAGGDMIVGTHAQLQQRLRLFQDLQDGTLDAGVVPRQQREALEQFAERRAMPGEAAAPARLSRSALRVWGWGTTGSIWPSRTISYQIGSSIPAGPRRQQIERAVAIWNAQSAVVLRSVGQVPPAERGTILTFVNHEAPDDEFACASWVGYRPGATQNVYVNPSCAAGNIAHEIGHAVGLHHEHQRLDRSALLTINASVPADSVNYGTLHGRRLSDHDLCSIMHYGAATTNPPWFSLTAAGQQTLLTCEQALAPICRKGQPGQRCQLSAGDVASLQSLYRG